ncbi:hypothetical protein QKU48_gp1088 [Fadolivirus algeromassiliense]|jgi:hypothetical protein|uniref:Uncharacterized protein n=1 Tax=Fadolivirus FV1/VV64 TaxID=3070911 RepID=A0A7D3QWG1_9VIRU|nr:hypothetical protein QKU48_gp1088 [Fadolivirus algeromassiliense]QKF94546.1 hypothetical protein Fadolivirus_1_1088 [Fadolivirus FV1/VV64]
MEIIYLLAITLLILLLLLFIPTLFNNIDPFFAPVDRPYYRHADYPRFHRADLDDIYLNTHTNFLFWNTQLGNKRNMSYDLRGDVPYPHFMWTPFNMASTVPIKNKPLYLVS